MDNKDIQVDELIIEPSASKSSGEGKTKSFRKAVVRWWRSTKEALFSEMCHCQDQLNCPVMDLEHCDGSCPICHDCPQM